jgi:XTP/dITP diphosphohydrolase
VYSLSNFSPYPPPIENGVDLNENALIKARVGFERTGVLTIADDTGLEVDALDGKPGVFSARYAGENATYDSNLRKVLNDLNAIPNAIRTALFRTAMALVGEGFEHCWEGVCKGKITAKPMTTTGFGYDPIFWSTELKKTFSEASREEKNKVSHRGRALKKLISFLDYEIIPDRVRLRKVF